MSTRPCKCSGSITTFGWFAWPRSGSAPRGLADEEDAALSAFDSFCVGVTAGRFPKLGGRDDLWRLLVTITGRNVLDQIEYETAGKRDRRRTLSEAALDDAGTEHEPGRGLAQIVGREPSPEFAARVAEETQTLLNRLPDDSLRQIAVLKLEGCLNEEIAAQTNCSLRSIERGLALIRKTWKRERSA
jgi:DNA-directed RNA polymerase specialized sigma24 family protein